MADTTSYHELNYQDNTRHYKDFVAGGASEEQARTWLQKDTVDAWRHQRLYGCLDPLLMDEGATWVTIGDGRFGKDSWYIAEKGREVVATDLDDSLLSAAREMGLIARYSQQNAEALSFADASFDYVFCKDSYHHFPRPMLALYEMLRVASKAVVLIEPNDRYISYSLLLNIWTTVINRLLSLVKRGIRRFNFEEFGNFVYSISRREMEKIAMGMNYRYLAFKGMNDSYTFGVEFEKTAANGKLFRKVRFRIRVQDMLQKLRVIDSVMLTAIIFKDAPADAMLQQLKRAGYEIVELPVNPYAHGSK